MYRRNAIALDSSGINVGFNSKRRKRFAVKSKNRAAGAKLFKSLLQPNERRSQMEAENQGNDIQSLFKEDPKGSIEERRVKVLYNNSFCDINGKL